MSLREVVSQRILVDILESIEPKKQWRVLVLDHLSTRIVSSCCRMHEIMDKGVTLVEAIEKDREPLPHLEAVYIMQPNEANINKLISDFDRPSEPKNLYKTVHIFFLQKCPPSLISKLGATLAARRIKTFKEINLAFLPYESKAFTLDYPEAFEEYFCQISMRRDDLLDVIADQLSTVCAMLGEYPAIRAWKDGQNRCVELGHKIQEKLDIFKSQNPNLGKGAKQTSEFIILDRGFDVMSPILHELTLQCMVYDVLRTDGDVYNFKTTGGDGQTREKQVILDENDEIWVQLRHLHIAEAATKISADIKEFAKKKKLNSADGELSIKDLARHIRRVPQYQKELGQFSLHLSLVDSCMGQYKSGIGKLCKVEQDLATGIDKDGLPVEEPLKIMMSSIFDRHVNIYDKIRLLSLFILQKKGVPLDEFTKVVQHSEIPNQERITITNLMHLGVPIIQGENVKPGKSLTPKEREEETYTDSRWSPIIRDIIEYAAEGKLDDSYCPYISKKSRASSSNIASASVTSTTSTAGASSVRKRYDWIPKSDQKETKSIGLSSFGFGGGATPTMSKKDVPTIFIFIIGGMTYSEMRTMHKVAQTHRNYDFVIGSTHIISPTRFLGDVRKLPSFMRL